MPYAVPDLRRFLAGAWRITRRIRDDRLGLAGRFAGHARFAEAPDGLAYDETGRLRFGAHEGNATQRYALAIDGAATAEVRFADGRSFHRLDLAPGEAAIVHACGADLYRGRYRVRDGDCWVQAWDIAGPRKKLRIVTRFRRMAPPPSVSAGYFGEIA